MVHVDTEGNLAHKRFYCTCNIKPSVQLWALYGKGSQDCLLRSLLVVFNILKNRTKEHSVTTNKTDYTFIIVGKDVARSINNTTIGQKVLLR